MKENLDLITVVIPVYNMELYLKECVDSVLSQSYDQLEIILVDDGSTDRSGKLCDEYKEMDNRILVIHKKNAGLGFARNSALEIFTGDYVTFLDSDDYISQNAIEILYKGLKENHVDECKMGFQRVKGEHIVCGEGRYVNEVFKGTEAKTQYAPRLIGSAPDRHDSINMCVWGTLFNGNVIREHNLRFPSERELISEDLIFHLEYLQHANGACTIENVEYKYRVNEVSLTRSYKADRLEKSLFFYDEVVRRLKIYGYGEDTINRAKRIFFLYIKGCVQQEVTYEKNDARMAIKKIDALCANKHLLEIIESYPIEKLGFRQRFFIECLKHKRGLLLYFLKRIGAY